MGLREQVCFEHHLHDETCFVDREEAQRKHLEWCRKQCEAGWPWPPDSGLNKQHRPIQLDPEWVFCPLCGRRVR